MRIKYKGALGNNIFQYVLARIICEEIGTEIMSFECPNREVENYNKNGTFNRETWNSYLINGGISIFKNTQNNNIKKFAYDFTINDGNINNIKYGNLVGKKIKLDGFFQNWDLYKNHIDKIRQWLEIEKVEGIVENSLTIHLRLGDFQQIPNWLDESKKGKGGDKYSWALNFHFYEEFLKDKKYDKIYLVSDTSEDNGLIRKLIENFDAEYIECGSFQEDFRFLCSSKNLLLSQSTFSWWAGILSDGLVYFPMTHNKCENSSHWNEKGHWEKRIKINLYPYDLDRVIKIYTYDKHYKLDLWN